MKYDSMKHGSMKCYFMLLHYNVVTVNVIPYNIALCTLRCQINIPVINFSIFFQPPDLVRIPRLLILRKLTLFTNTSFHFLSLLVQFTHNFHGKIKYSCTYFSFMLYDNPFLFFPSLYNHLKPFLKFQPPVY